MANVLIIQGRAVGEPELALIGGLLASHPEWNRTRLSRVTGSEQSVLTVFMLGTFSLVVV